MAEQKHGDSYDWTCFEVLAYEFKKDDPKEAEKKIRRRLRRQNLGPFEQDRIDYIRSLEDELQREIGLFDKSRYYVGPSGPLAAIADFDVNQMLNDFGGRYKNIRKDDLYGIIGFALYLYYLR